MRMYDLIAKKKQGGSLTREEIHFMVDGFVSGGIPDYQMSAMLMAICFQGMTAGEILELTLAMEGSGDVMELSQLPGIKVDKHSTGGVGDKTTLIVAPLVAALGGRVAKMSGRGLGYTGGTLDKLEAIPGFQTALTREEFFRTVNEVGVSVMGQTGNMVPADKKLYALRDVTATVDSIPLIASSIMSKKLAAGSDAIVLDVKCGSGAFMKTLEDAIRLAQTMVDIGEKAGRRTVALITEMGIPLGRAVGNSLEVMEAVDTLRGQGPADLQEICCILAAEMLSLCGLGDVAATRRMAEEALLDGRALDTFFRLVQAQHGDASILAANGLPRAAHSFEVRAEQEGYVCAMDTEGIGLASMLLGAGRARKEDALDYAAGLCLQKKYGDYVKKGEVLAVLYASRPDLFEEASRRLLASYRLDEKAPEPARLVYARVDREGVLRF